MLQEIKWGLGFEKRDLEIFRPSGMFFFFFLDIYKIKSLSIWKLIRKEKKNET